MKSKKELSIKLDKAIERNVNFSKIVKKQAQRIRDLEKSRAAWKGKSADKSLTINLLARQASRVETRPARHQYSLGLIGLCLNLRLFAGASYRSVVKILLILQLGGHLKMGRVPCANSIENWTKKLGYQALKVDAGEGLGDSVAVIVDESMRIGPYKQLLVLGVDAEKTDDSPLAFSGVRVLGMFIEKSFTGERISEVLLQLLAQTGKQMAYGLSDDDAKLKKAFRLLDIPRVSDASHAMGRCLEQVFKGDPLYQAFSKAASQWISKGVNRDYAHLLPPKQRVMARFMNIAPLVKWAKNVLKDFEKLPTEARAAFDDLKEHEAIIGDLDMATCLADAVSGCLKSKGLSGSTVAECLDLVGDCTHASPKTTIFKEKIINYLNEMKLLIKDPKSVWQCSSEVIESLFGKRKFMDADNRLVQNGVNLLEMPLYCLTPEQLSDKICPALEGTFLSQFKVWFDSQFPVNQALTRNLFFKKCKKVMPV